MKFTNIFAETKIRINRGNSLVGEIKNVIYISAGLKIIFQNISILTLAILSIVILFLFWFIGYLDLKYFKILQEEQRLTSQKYNPYFKKFNKLFGIPKNKRYLK
jgi:hypothetical protein